MACDYAFYLSMICGYGTGFYRTSGDVKWLYMAGVGSLGVVASFWAVAYAKKSYARREPRGDYYVAFQRTTRAHDANPVQNFTRTMTFLVTRAVFPYYMVLFAVLGISKVMFIFMMIGCQLTWILTLNASRLKPTLTPQAPDRKTADAFLTAYREAGGTWHADRFEWVLATTWLRLACVYAARLAWPDLPGDLLVDVGRVLRGGHAWRAARRGGIEGGCR